MHTVKLKPSLAASFFIFFVFMNTLIDRPETSTSESAEQIMCAAISDAMTEATPLQVLVFDELKAGIAIQTELECAGYAVRMERLVFDARLARETEKKQL